VRIRRNIANKFKNKTSILYVDDPDLFCEKSDKPEDLYLTEQERRLKKLQFQIICISFEEFCAIEKV